METGHRYWQTLSSNSRYAEQDQFMHLDDTVCYCFHVTWRKLENWARRHRPRVASQLSACGGAGTGCGWCIPFLRLIHRRVAGEVSSTLSAFPPKQEEERLVTLSAAEYAALRDEYIRSRRGQPPTPVAPAQDRTPQDSPLQESSAGVPLQESR
jgi:bacterioferritin-associated ferredoxin